MIDTIVLRNIVDELPYSAGYKDKKSVFTYTNLEYAKVVGLKCALDVTGRTAYDMPAKTSECAPLFHEQNETVMSTGKRLIVFGIHPDEQGNFRAYKFLKVPLRGDNGEIEGTFFTGEEISNRTTYELSSFIKNIPIKADGKLLIENGSYLIGTEHTAMKISKREHEVLFYLLRGKRAKFIAHVLSITPRTVYKHMTQLRYEFGVVSSAELKDKAAT